MSKLLFCFLIVIAVCNTNIHFRYDIGTMKVNAIGSSLISGFITQHTTEYYVDISGMFNHQSTTMPFLMRASPSGMRVTKKGTEYIYQCVRGEWGFNSMNLEGTVKLLINETKTEYNGQCSTSDNTTIWTIMARGNKKPCKFYPLIESGLRAIMMIGKPTKLYKSNQVINYAITGYPYFGETCAWYLHNAKETNVTKPGLLMIDNKGTACAIVDNEGDKFIYGNTINGLVESSPIVLYKKYFPNGYVLRDYSC